MQHLFFILVLSSVTFVSHVGYAQYDFSSGMDMTFPIVSPEEPQLPADSIYDRPDANYGNEGRRQPYPPTAPPSSPPSSSTPVQVPGGKNRGKTPSPPQEIQMPTGGNIQSVPPSAMPSGDQQSQPEYVQDPGSELMGPGIGCEQFFSLQQSCEAEFIEAGNDCDAKKNGGMSNVTNSLSQLTLMMGQQTAASINAACSKMAGLISAANGALAAYRLNCHTSISSCRSSCQAAAEFLSRNPQCSSVSPRSLVDRCSQFEGKVNEANAAIANLGMTARNASQCDQLSAGDVPAFCIANPQYPGCSPAAPVDCADPTVASTNKVCICKSNPMNPACQVEQKAGADNSVAQINSGSRAPGSSSDSFGGDIPDLPMIAHGQLPSGGGQAIDGQQGGGAGLGGGGGGSGGSYSGTGAGNDGDDNSGSGAVNAGYYGGGGSGGQFLAAGSGGPGGASAGRATGVTGANPHGADLRKFLPGGSYDPRIRGLGGSAGPDGITGPHSNIWKKIQNRYQVVSPSLIP